MSAQTRRARLHALQQVHIARMVSSTAILASLASIAPRLMLHLASVMLDGTVLLVLLHVLFALKDLPVPMPHSSLKYVRKAPVRRREPLSVWVALQEQVVSMVLQHSAPLVSFLNKMVKLAFLAQLEWLAQCVNGINKCLVGQDTTPL